MFDPVVDDVYSYDHEYLFIIMIRCELIELFIIIMCGRDTIYPSHSNMKTDSYH